MDVELITIGDELLLGLTIDTNAAWLARELGEIGVRIVWRSTVGDRADHINAAVQTALERTGAVITTGGLGPTADDLTKPTIADIFGRGMHFDAELWEGLKRIWRERGRPGEIPEVNKQQVMIPDGADVMPNRHGTAPGIWLENEKGCWVAMLPGVPREMRGLARDELFPRILSRLGAAAHSVQSYTLRTTGIAESQIPALFGEYATEIDGIRIAYQPSPAGVDIRLTISGMTREDGQSRLEKAAAVLRERLGARVYGVNSQDLVSIVLDACRERGWHIAVAESCTGGLLGERLTRLPGSSAVVTGGVVAYSNTVKEALLRVSPDDLKAHGAVSEPVVRAMAKGAREVT
ncbi:MAG: CinA family nicotinamide mononucleotide deamidase-related protein, partial [Gemmatimonadota bacterium]